MDPAAANALSASVHWYEAMFRAHGVPWTIADGVLAAGGEPPPYHSRAVALAAGEPARQASVVARMRAAVPGPFTVKDSFARLDLAPLGFRVLFEAQWILREPGDAPPDAAPPARWRRVSGTGDLDRWEAAWKANGSPAETRCFPPSLLEDGTVALLAAVRGDRFVAGCAANRAAGAVGLSNLFAEDAEDDGLFAEAIREAEGFAPGLPVVGYESGAALERARRHGFRAVGPLRVWRL